MAMRLDSPRVIGLAGSALVLAGWMLGSTLSPPVARTQTRERAAAPEAPAAEIVPLRDLDSIRPHPAPPTPTRNPFAFAAASARRSEPAMAAAPDVASAAPREDGAPAAAAARGWHLIGVATAADGAITAVLGRDGDVQLVQAGDTLPDGTSVTSATLDAVVLTHVDGTTLDLRLP